MSKTYNALLTRAAELYSAARLGDPLALAVETIMCSVASEIEDFHTFDDDDEEAIASYIEFVADEKGYTLHQIVGGCNRVLIDSESYRLKDHRIVAKQTVAKRYMVIEMDGTEDGRLIAHFQKKSDLMDVVKAMGWEIYDDLS